MKIITIMLVFLTTIAEAQHETQKVGISLDFEQDGKVLKGEVPLISVANITMKTSLKKPFRKINYTQVVARNSMQVQKLTTDTYDGIIRLESHRWLLTSRDRVVITINYLVTEDLKKITLQNNRRTFKIK